MANLKNQKVFVAIVIAVLVIVLFLIFHSYAHAPSSNINTTVLPERNDNAPAVQVLTTYPTKIVYTTDTDSAQDDYQADCELRNGVFDACGTTCAPNASSCAQTCAFTCDISTTTNE